MHRLTVNKGEEVVATIVSDIHFQTLPCITCSQLTFFSLYQCQVNRLAHLAPFHHHLNIHFVNGRVNHSSEVEHLFDSRMLILSMNAHDLLWIQAVTESVTMWSTLTCHWSTRLTPFKVASISARFMCLASFSSRSQQASTLMALLVSRVTPMASELASTQIYSCWHTNLLVLNHPESLWPRFQSACFSG